MAANSVILTTCEGRASRSRARNGARSGLRRREPPYKPTTHRVCVMQKVNNRLCKIPTVASECTGNSDCADRRPIARQPTLPAARAKTQDAHPGGDKHGQQAAPQNRTECRKTQASPRPRKGPRGYDRTIEPVILLIFRTAMQLRDIIAVRGSRPLVARPCCVFARSLTSAFRKLNAVANFCSDGCLVRLLGRCADATFRSRTHWFNVQQRDERTTP